MNPITKHESRDRNDRRAASIYQSRTRIDQKLRDMQLAREIKEVWQ